MRKRSDGSGLVLMARSLNRLYSRFQATMRKASPEEVEEAMYTYLRRCERARNALGKDWMKWFPGGSRKRQSSK